MKSNDLTYSYDKTAVCEGRELDMKDIKAYPWESPLVEEL